MDDKESRRTERRGLRFSGHSLTGIEGFPQKHSERLAEYGITSAEQFIGVARETRALTRLLGVSAEELGDLRKIAFDSLPEDIVQKLKEIARRPKPPLGALPPRPRIIE